MNGAERPGRPGTTLHQQMELPAHLSVAVAPQAAGLPMAGHEGQQEGRPVRGWHWAQTGSVFGKSSRGIKAENFLRALTGLVALALHLRDGRR